MPRDFFALYGRPPGAAGEAPGRVNLIGEHTDYNRGYVLPAAISLKTRVEIAPRPDCAVRVWTASFPEEEPRAYRIGEESRRGGWLDYVEAVTWTLREGGASHPGFDARIESTVPAGAGLASSASLQIAALRALRGWLGLTHSDLDLARFAHRAETAFVGAPVGIMDQMACSLGGPGAALLLDTRTLQFESVLLPRSIDFAVIDSGVRHGHAEGEYRTRRAECEEAASRLGVDSLRDLEGAPPSAWAKLPELLGRRVRHVISENARVLLFVQALRSEDAAALGELLLESHRSLRDDFEVSTRELDLLVDLARKETAIRGARMTGGGFGGSVLLAGTPGEVRDAAVRIARRYSVETARKAEVLLPPA